MNALEQLIEENKSKFIIDSEELQKRIEARVSSYKSILPAINLELPAYLKVRKFYTNLQNMIIDATDKLQGDFTLDSPNSNVSGSGFVLTFIKSKELQKKDLVSIKKEVKALYEQELGIKKSKFIQRLTSNQQLESKAAAEKLAADNSAALQLELSELLNSK
jgi:hypothetical protein